MERILEIALLLFFGLPLLRLAFAGPVRRELRARPALLLPLAVLGLAALALLAAAGARQDASLRVGVGIASALALFAWGRARADYGTRRGLPPGSLGIGASLASVGDPDFYVRQARKHGPVFKMSQFHRPTVCVVDLPLGLGFLESEADGLEQPSLAFGRAVPGNYIELMNGDIHRLYRGIFQPAFNGRVIREGRARVGAVIRGGLARMAEDAREDGTSPDPHLEAIAFASLLDLFFGVREGSPRFEAFRSVYQEMGSAGLVAPQASQSLGGCIERASALVRDLIEEGPSESDEEETILAAALRDHPERAGDRVLLGNLVFMLEIGRNNIDGFLGWVLKLACDHPQWLLQLREGGAAADGLATRMVSETLRLAQSEYVYRVAVRDCRLGPFRIPRGWLVRICLRECHRRADVFPDPEAFDPDRFQDMPHGKQAYAPFSDGSHSCFGASLVMMVARSFLTELARGFDVRIVKDGPPERGNRHWNHWRPSSKLRVALAPRAIASVRADAVGA